MKIIFSFIVILISLVQIVSAEVIVDWDIKKLEDKFKGEIETGVKEYLGAEKKFKVYVQVSGRKKTEEKKASDFNDTEFGYLSVADSYQDVKILDKVVVNSVSAEIFIYDKIDRAVENNIRKISSGAMKGFPNTTILSVMPSPPKIEEKKPEAPETPFDLKKFLMDHASDIFKMFSTLFVGALALLGLYLLGRALIAAFKTIGDAMKDSTDKIARQQKENKEQELEAKKNDEQKLAHQKIEEVFNNQLEIQFERNINIVKSCLRVSPHVFKQVLIRNEENLNGLKTLLPLIVDYTVKLKEAISQDLWKKVESLKGIEEGLFNRWLNAFAEDISVAQMTENGYFSYVIDHNLLERAYAAKFSHLVDASMRINSGVLYKFVLDFLPPEESTHLMKHFDEETWKMILTERYINAAELNDDVANMLKIVDEYVEKEKREINDQGLARILTNPMTLFLQGKSFEESEELFDILSMSAPDLATLLKSKFWTPRTLYRVPSEYLREKFNTLTVEARVHILLAVQEDIRNFMLGFIPEGKVMTIVTDQYNRDVETFDERARIKSVKVLKEFLDNLKADATAEKFILKEELEEVADEYQQETQQEEQSKEQNELQVDPVEQVEASEELTSEEESENLEEPIAMFDDSIPTPQELGEVTQGTEEEMVNWEDELKVEELRPKSVNELEEKTEVIPQIPEGDDEDEVA